jgi:hypothetical protein
MNRDSAAAARIVNAAARPGQTILVWGYRPDILVYTRLALGAPYLDSQPLTGVLADRHLVSSHVTMSPLETARNRALLGRTSPTFIVDGLGPYNPDLAIAQFPELRGWLERYVLIGEISGCRVYRLNPVSLAAHLNSQKGTIHHHDQGKRRPVGQAARRRSSSVEQDARR